MKALSNTIVMTKGSKSPKYVGRGSSKDGRINAGDKPNFLNEIFQGTCN